MSGDFCIFAVRFLNNDIMDKNKMTEENPAIDYIEMAMDKARREKQQKKKDRRLLLRNARWGICAAIAGTIALILEILRILGVIG